MLSTTDTLHVTLLNCLVQQIPYICDITDVLSATDTLHVQQNVWKVYEWQLKDVKYIVKVN